MKTNTKNQKSGLKSRPEQLSTGNRAGMPNQMLSTGRLLGLLRQQAPRLFELAQVVGKWVWIEFEQRQPRYVIRALMRLGFHWNRARQVWQHPCGVFCEKASAYDPRSRYGSYYAADIIHG